MLGRHDVGHRVVVRQIVGKGQDRPIFSDVLGELVEVGETDLTIRTRTGPVSVPVRSIAMGKRIPDRRRLTATESLERVAAAGWPVPDQEPLGEWLLRSAEGFTNRGNSVLAVGDPDRPLPAAIDEVTRWYASRGRTPAITVPEPVGGRVIRELTARGWTPSPTTLVRTAALDTIIAAVGSGETPDLAIRLDQAPPEPWLTVVAGRKGGLPASAWHILTAVPAVRFAGIYDGDPGTPDGGGDPGTPDGDRALAIARGVVAEDGEWLGLALIEVDPTHRRRGLARALLGALAGWATGIGASRAYLQVEERNEAAVKLYDRLGFSTHHRYATWRPPSPGPASVIT